MTNILVVEDRDSKYELLEGELKLMNVKFSRGRSIPVSYTHLVEKLKGYQY